MPINTEMEPSSFAVDGEENQLEDKPERPLVGAEQLNFAKKRIAEICYIAMSNLLNQSEAKDRLSFSANDFDKSADETTSAFANVFMQEAEDARKNGRDAENRFWFDPQTGIFVPGNYLNPNSPTMERAFAVAEGAFKKNIYEIRDLSALTAGMDREPIFRLFTSLINNGVWDEVKREIQADIRSRFW